MPKAGVRRETQPGNRFALCWLLIAVSLVGTAFFTALRWRYEHRFGRVQIVLDYDDVRIVADGSRVPLDRMLRALRQRGATGLALNEQTLTLMRESGRLTVTPRAKALELFPSLRAAFADKRLAYRVWNAADPGLMRAVEAHLHEQSPRDGAVRGVALRGGTRGVLVPASPQLFNDASLGYDEAHLATARAAGLRPVARMANRINMNAARLGQRLDEARATGARLVLFDDTEIPGYSSLTAELARGLGARGLSFGALEFSAQRGAPELAEASAGNFYRVHAVAPNEAARWRRDELADRYARAARERNVRAVLVRLLRRPARANGGHIEDVFATNTRLIGEIRRKLGEAPGWVSWLGRVPATRGFSLALRAGEGGPFLDFPSDSLRPRVGPATPWLLWMARALCGLGALGAWLLLLQLLLGVPRRSVLTVLAGGGASIALLAAAGPTGAKLLAFGAAAAWPVVAFAWGGWPDLVSRRGASPRAVAAALARTAALAVAGGLNVAALLCDWRFLSKTAEFWGTKPAQLLPLALAAVLIAGEWSPREVARHGAGPAQERFRRRANRLLDSGFTVQVALSTGAIAFVLWLWMARSGNESSLAVSAFEWKLRATLEGWFMARPRNKELFGAYPAFVLSLWCAARGWKPAAAALGLAAVIGPIDVVNSFCQASNPLALSLWRSVWGVVLGGAIGMLAVGALQARRASLRPSPKTVHLAAAGGTIALGWLLLARRHEARQYALLTAPAAEAAWPWPAARREALSAGVTHWFDASAADGTTLDLMEFDFERDPRLRFEILDRDAADAHPFDNRVHYWRQGLAPMAASAQAAAPRRGEVVVLVNGSFFGLLNHKPRDADEAFHLAPIVLEGKVHYAGTGHRWTFGTRKSDGPHPIFEAEHLPSRRALERFQYASGTAQCVMKNGVPLRLTPLPHGEVSYEASPAAASSQAEAGHIRVLDWMKTSRVSFGWNRDSTKLWLLFVKEPDGETPSRAAVHGARPGAGGWTLAEVQRFWLSHGANGRGAATAVVTDGGDVAQLALHGGGQWLLVPPRFSTTRGAATQRFSLTDLKQAPQSARRGGALMYFVIRRAPDGAAGTAAKPVTP